MAVVTVTFTDLDLDAGSFSSKMVVENSKMDDGQVTAAHMMGVFIEAQMSNPEFINKMWAFAQELVLNNADVDAEIANPFSAINDNVVGITSKTVSL